MNVPLRQLLFLLTVAVCADASAQTAAEAAPGGTVTGVITYGDTQRPARFSKVTLTPVKPKEPDLKSFSDKDVKDDPAAAMKVLGALMGSVTMLQAQTGLDGSYTLSDVAPGDYYLSPSAPGVCFAVGAGGCRGAGGCWSRKDAGRRAGGACGGEPHDAWRCGTGARCGASMGAVIFDDGSPVAGVIVQFESVKSAAAKAAKKAAKKKDDDDADMADFGSAMSLAMSGGLVIATTDDRGRFRLAGIAGRRVHRAGDGSRECGFRHARGRDGPEPGEIRFAAEVLCSRNSV